MTAPPDRNDDTRERERAQASAPKPPPRPGRGKLVLAALVAAAALGAGLWAGGVLPPRPAPEAPAAPPEPAAEVAARLAAAPDYAPFFDTLAARFPADSTQLREAFATASPGDRAAATADRFVADALKHLRQTRGIVASKADAPAMARVFEAQGAMIAALRDADPRLCVDFVYGGATGAFMDFVERRRPLFAAVAKANLDAILDGADRKIERDAPTDEDFAALEAALRGKGMGDPEIAALLDGKTPDPPLPDAQMCAAGKTYLQTLATLPEETRLRIYALAVELMARS